MDSSVCRVPEVREAFARVMQAAVDVLRPPKPAVVEEEAAQPEEQAGEPLEVIMATDPTTAVTNIEAETGSSVKEDAEVAEVTGWATDGDSGDAMGAAALPLPLPPPSEDATDAAADTSIETSPPLVMAVSVDGGEASTTTDISVSKDVHVDDSAASTGATTVGGGSSSQDEDGDDGSEPLEEELRQALNTVRKLLLRSYPAGSSGGSSVQGAPGTITTASGASVPMLMLENNGGSTPAFAALDITIENNDVASMKVYTQATAVDDKIFLVRVPPRSGAPCALCCTKLSLALLSNLSCMPTARDPCRGVFHVAQEHERQMAR